jgi:signal transduction histidine kinase
MAVEGTARPVPAAVDLIAYRVIQESLTNVRKHAGTPMATVRLRYGQDRLCIVVEDEGSGSSTVDDPVAEHGHGIVGMGERAAAVGGTLHAGPRPGGGFQVQATLPMRAAALAS